MQHSSRRSHALSVMSNTSENVAFLVAIIICFLTAALLVDWMGRGREISKHLHYHKTQMNALNEMRRLHKTINAPKAIDNISTILKQLHAHQLRDLDTRKPAEVLMKSDELKDTLARIENSVKNLRITPAITITPTETQVGHTQEVAQETRRIEDAQKIAQATRLFQIETEGRKQDMIKCSIDEGRMRENMMKEVGKRYSEEKAALRYYVEEEKNNHQKKLDEVQALLMSSKADVQTLSRKIKTTAELEQSSARSAREYSRELAEKDATVTNLQSILQDEKAASKEKGAELSTLKEEFDKRIKHTHDVCSITTRQAEELKQKNIVLSELELKVQAADTSLAHCEEATVKKDTRVMELEEQLNKAAQDLRDGQNILITQRNADGAKFQQEVLRSSQLQDQLDKEVAHAATLEEDLITLNVEGSTIGVANDEAMSQLHERLQVSEYCANSYYFQIKGDPSSDVTGLEDRVVALSNELAQSHDNDADIVLQHAESIDELDFELEYLKEQLQAAKARGNQTQATEPKRDEVEKVVTGKTTNRGSKTGKIPMMVEDVLVRTQGTVQGRRKDVASPAVELIMTTESPPVFFKHANQTSATESSSTTAIKEVQIPPEVSKTPAMPTDKRNWANDDDGSVLSLVWLATEQFKQKTLQLDSGSRTFSPGPEKPSTGKEVDVFQSGHLNNTQHGGLIEWPAPSTPSDTKHTVQCRYCSRWFPEKSHRDGASIYQHFDVCKTTHRTCRNEGCGLVVEREHWERVHRERCKRSTIAAGRKLFNPKDPKLATLFTKSARKEAKASPGPAVSFIATSKGSIPGSRSASSAGILPFEDQPRTPTAAMRPLAETIISSSTHNAVTGPSSQIVLPASAKVS